MSFLEQPVVLWVKHPETYVKTIQTFIWRIQSAQKFATNLRGFVDGSGQLVEKDWKDIFKMRPTAIEISHVRNPFKQFLQALNTGEEQHVADFLSKLTYVSVNLVCINEVSASNLVTFLSKVQLLEAFSYFEVHYSLEEWLQIASQLKRLNVRALDVASNVLDSLLAPLDIELVRFSGGPGVDVKALLNNTAEFVTVQTLICQELNFVSETDAEEFLSVLPQKFPRVSTLFWDWNMVDPAVMFDNRTKNIIKKLVKVYKTLQLGLLAILFYTPDAETKRASQEITKEFNDQELDHLDMKRFSSSGVDLDTPNFTIIFAGTNLDKREIVDKLMVKKGDSVPNLRRFLPLLSPGSAIPSGPPAIIDFGGFDSSTVRKTFENKKWDEEIQL